MQGHFARGDGPPAYAVDLDRLPHDSVSVAVLSVVAGYTDTPIEDLNPLTESVDPDTLEDLLDGTGGKDPSRSVVVRFQYHGLSIAVTNAGLLELSPVDRPPGAASRREPPRGGD